VGSGCGRRAMVGMVRLRSVLVRRRGVHGLSRGGRRLRRRGAEQAEQARDRTQKGRHRSRDRTQRGTHRLAGSPDCGTHCTA
jgi:hypothetical protein